MTYEITLTAAQIAIIKLALDAYEQPLTDLMNDNEGRTGYGKQIYDKAKKRLSQIDPIYQTISEQLSDQQPDFTPLSQREYPQ